jgi:hypothetical protein
MNEAVAPLARAINGERISVANNINFVAGRLSFCLLSLRVAMLDGVSICTSSDRDHKHFEEYVQEAYEEITRVITQLRIGTDMETFCDPAVSKKVLEAAEALGAHIENLERRAMRDADCHQKHKPEVRKAVWELTGGVCAYCDTDLAPDGVSGQSFVVEHVVPVSKGGPDNLANYVPACATCNVSKTDGHVLEFIRKRLGKESARRGFTVIDGRTA